MLDDQVIPDPGLQIYAFVGRRYVPAPLVTWNHCTNQIHRKAITLVWLPEEFCSLSLSQSSLEMG
jgi:hypothetical protein